jgi:hypothetical protein
MRRLQAIALIFVSILFIKCQKEIGYEGGIESKPALPSPITAVLQGNILDESGQPAPGVNVRVGSKTAVTDNRGYFRIMDAPLDKQSALVIAEKPGYFKGYRTFHATSGANHVLIQLIKRELTGTIDAASGGDVTLTNGMKIALPAGGVVTASNGAAYTGTINVYAAYIDPTSADIGRTVPGSLMADDKDGGRVILSSYGMMAVDLASPSGEKLQVKNGSKAAITSPIPSSLQSSAPASIALWSVDEATGIWQEEGTAQKNGSSYTGEVSHFSFWNCDIGIAGVTVSLTLNDPDGDPLVHGWVRIRTTGSNPSWTYGYTDSLGQVSGFVPANQSLVLEVLNFCNEPVYAQNIGPFSQNTNLGIITLSSSASTSLKTIKGILKDCSSNSVSNGYAIIYYGYNVRFAELDANGVFEADFIVCNNSTTTFQVLGVDEGSGQQSNLYTGTISGALNDIGILTACGNSASQFINFTLDGTSYSITDATDSIGAYTQPLGGSTTGPYLTSIDGWQNTSGGGNINFNFEHAVAGPGTYPMATLNVQTFQQAVLSNTSSVTITSYPANPGEFYEGSFSAAFTVGTTIHNVTNAQFRIRRNF